MAETERKTKRCPTDLTGAGWARIAPLLAAPHRRGRPRRTDLREALNAIRCLVRTGCGWRMLPKDFAPWQTVCWWFRRFVRQMLFATIHALALMLDRQRAGRTEVPSAGVPDGQTVKAPAAGADRGRDGAKRTVGRRRHIAVGGCHRGAIGSDPMAGGRLLMVNLTPADISDTAGAKAVLQALRARWPWMKTLFADSAHDRAGLMDEAAMLDFTVEVARKTEGQAGFQVLPRRRVVQRTLARRTRRHRLEHDCEARIDVSEAMTHVATASPLIRRLSH